MSELSSPRSPRIFSDCSRTLRISASTSRVTFSTAGSGSRSTCTRKGARLRTNRAMLPLATPCTSTFTRPSGSFSSRSTRPTVPVR